MTNGVKIAIGVTAVFLAAAAVRVGLIYRANHADDSTTTAAGNDSSPNVKVDPDDNVFLKKQHPDTIADEKALIGATVWVSAGGQLYYYKDSGKHVDYAHPVGLLLQNQPMLIKEVFEQGAPKTGNAVFRIAAGQRQVLLGFTMPGSDDPKAVYATPVGNFYNGYNLYNDDILFYDDPHKLYDYWGAQTWANIDKHQPTVGMTERQVMMCVGQVQTPHGGTYGNRSITYDNSGHPLTIDFENNKAIKVTPGE